MPHRRGGVMTTISALLLAESRAAFMERNHQEVCRAYRAGLDCLSCAERERDWVAADIALSDFQRELRRAS